MPTAVRRTTRVLLVSFTHWMVSRETTSSYVVSSRMLVKTGTPMQDTLGDVSKEVPSENGGQVTPTGFGCPSPRIDKQYVNTTATLCNTIHVEWNFVKCDQYLMSICFHT